MISVTQLHLPQTTRRYEVSSICHISCPNVKCSLTHLQVAAVESAVLASQFSQHNLKPGFLPKNVTTGNECPGKLSTLGLSPK
jgi:hypothetical protein